MNNIEANQIPADEKPVKRITIVFPRWTEDVVSHRRLLLHWVEDEFYPGDHFTLINFWNAPRGVPAIVTSVDKVRLHEVTDEDLRKIGNVTRESYIASWNKTQPDHPWNSNPEVYRIEFRYATWEDGRGWV